MFYMVRYERKESVTTSGMITGPTDVRNGVDQQNPCINGHPGSDNAIATLPIPLNGTLPAIYPSPLLPAPEILNLGT